MWREEISNHMLYATGQLFTVKATNQHGEDNDLGTLPPSLSGEHTHLQKLNHLKVNGKRRKIRRATKWQNSFCPPSNSGSAAEVCFVPDAAWWLDARMPGRTQRKSKKRRDGVAATVVEVAGKEFIWGVGNLFIANNQTGKSGWIRDRGRLGRNPPRKNNISCTWKQCVQKHLTRKNVAKTYKWNNVVL